MLLRQKFERLQDRIGLGNNFNDRGPRGTHYGSRSFNGGDSGPEPENPEGIRLTLIFVYREPFAEAF